MGVRLYFKREVLSNSTAIQYDDKKPPQCDKLFLDFNAFCHEQRKQKIDEYGKEALKNKDIINGVLKSMDTLIDYIKPQKLLYIAVDGVAPKAKIVQQRERRFMKVWQEKHDPNTTALEPNEEFIDAVKDSNEISPGTSFMKSLTEKVQAHLKTKRYKQFTTIFSSANEEGEGEHKIFKYISSNIDTTNNDEENTLIYGLDADLIILSLINIKQNIILMRNHKDSMTVDKDLRIKAQENNNNYGYIFVHIDTFRKNICEKMKWRDLLHESIGKHEIMYDYCVLVSLLGNDFIPSLSFLSVENYGIDYILQKYFEIRKNTTKTLVYKDTTKGDRRSMFHIDWNILSKLLEKMVEDEDTAFHELEEKYYNKKPREETNIEEYPIVHKSIGRIYPKTSGWRMRFANYHLNSRNGIEGVSEAVYQYLCGLQFVVEYYLNQKQFDGWYYPHNLSPPMMDIYMTIEASNTSGAEQSCSSISHEVKRRLHTYHDNYIKPTPQEVLLLILPKQSKHLILKKYHPILEKPKHECMHYYPDDFVLDTYLKHKLFQCKPIVPDTNDTKIITEARKLNKTK